MKDCLALKADGVTIACRACWFAHLYLPPSQLSRMLTIIPNASSYIHHVFSPWWS